MQVGKRLKHVLEEADYLQMSDRALSEPHFLHPHA